MAGTINFKTGKIDRDSNVRFALSPEECGLLIDQLEKDQKVEFLRRAYNPDHMETHDAADKVMYVTPGQGGMTSFKVDFEKDGVGGQEQQAVGNAPPVMGPLEVVVQSGEMKLMLSLIEHSMPMLAGWSTLMDISLNRSIHLSLKHDESGGGGHGGGPHFSTSDDSGVPF